MTDATETKNDTISTLKLLDALRGMSEYIGRAFLEGK